MGTWRRERRGHGGRALAERGRGGRVPEKKGVLYQRGRGIVPEREEEER